MLLHENETEYILLTHGKLDTQLAQETVILPWTGGTSCFIGTTRNVFENKKVKTLFYEAYEEMALKELRAICDVIKTKFSVGKICLMHRLGEVGVGEASVVVCVSSMHRLDAIKAVEFGIDELKAKVPIWKKEIYEDDGGAEWKENKEVFWK